MSIHGCDVSLYSFLSNINTKRLAEGVSSLVIEDIIAPNFQYAWQDFKNKNINTMTVSSIVVFASSVIVYNLTPEDRLSIY